MREETLIIKSTIKLDREAHAISYPVFYTSTYWQEGPGTGEYEYSRSGNPTRALLENALAALEGGKFAFAFASGMSAIDAVLRLLSPGDEVIACDDLYGGTFRLFQGYYQNMGISFRFVDMTDLESFRKALTSRTRMVWLETPTNPLLKIIDIAEVSRVTKEECEAVVVVDNTFATPYLQKPLNLGADVVVHSITKYLGGHSDVIMGAVITNSDSIAEKIKFIQKSAGAIPSPMDCFLVLRGIKTLHLRMERHCENAFYLAQHLRGHPRIRNIYYPFLEESPQVNVARKQMRGGGGMFSIEIDGSKEEAIRFMQNLKVFHLAESLGGVESLVCHPATMTHAWLSPEWRLSHGITDTLVRFSVGVENKEDLLEDILNALKCL